MEVVPFWAINMTFFGSLILPWTPVSLSEEWLFAPYVVATILGASYGVLIIATARRPRPKPIWFFRGLTSTPTAARWYGLACLLPSATAWGIVIVVNVTSIQLRRDQVETVLFVSGPIAALLAFGVCIALASRAANRPIKQAILAGLAPYYFTAPGLPAGYWWDRGSWRSIADSAPEDALRSPDGHYWWAGGSWIPMPPYQANKDLLKAASAT